MQFRITLSEFGYALEEAGIYSAEVLPEALETNMKSMNGRGFVDFTWLEG